MTGHLGMGLVLRRVFAITAPLVLVLVFPAFASALEQQLTASDGGAGDLLGRSVAVDGDTAVVGAPGADGGAAGDVPGAGAVYVFTRSGDSWVQTAKLTASDGASPHSLGTSVAIDGDTIVAGAPLAGGGVVYTFARSGAAQRTEVAKLTVSDPMATLVGGAVAIDGATIVAGSGRPRVYTFARTGSAQRTETATLVASDVGTSVDPNGNVILGGSIGGSVAIDGDTIVAGASRDNDNPVTVFGNVGAVYTFAAAGAAVRNETAKLTAAAGSELSLVGASVAIEGDTIVAGAPGLTVPGGPVDDEFEGSLFTFSRTGPSKRTATAQLIASDAAGNDGLGISVAIDGDAIVGGAPEGAVVVVGGAPGDDAYQGSAYTFARTGAAQRNESAKLTAPDGAAYDGFGGRVAIDRGTTIAGASGDDVGASAEQGSAWVFFSPAPPPVATCFGTRATIVPAAGQTVVEGTPGRDVIVGTHASETIDGGGGDDLVCAGRGDDRVRGGRGDDRVRGDAGNDTVRGGRDDDRVRGDAGNDTVRGGRGDDKVGGDSGSDRLFGGSGDDLVHSTDDRASDEVDCGRGFDSALIDGRDHPRRCERIRRT